MKLLFKLLVSISTAQPKKNQAKKKKFYKKINTTLGHLVIFLSLFLIASPKAFAQTFNDVPAGGITFSNATNPCTNAGLLVRSFNVNTDISVGSASLGLNVSHGFRGAIRGFLQSPSGSFMEFLNINGGDTNDNYDVLFQDGGGAIDDGNNDAVGPPFYDRTVNPDSALSTFVGESASGTWRLYLCDGGSAFTGTYNRSQLTISPPDISGFAFDDVDRDNTRGANEGALANISVTAYRDDGDGVYEPGTDDVQVATTQTGTNGGYAFNGLANGNYWIDVNENDSDLAGRSYGGSAATNTADPRLVSFSGTAVADVDFPFFQDLQFLCEAGDPSGELTFLDGAVLESGNDLQIGAKYRFSDVFENVDALVEVVAFNGGASLAAIDNDTTGVSAAFQPTLNAISGTTSSVDFIITLVAKGTETPVSLTFRAAGVDIDGDGGELREFIELTNLTSFSTGSSLDATTIPSGNRFESNTTDVQPGVSATATQTIVVAQYDSVSQFRYRIGSNDSGTGGALQRLNSLYIGCTSGPPPTASNPDVLLVKRITKINGQTTNPNDNTLLNTFVDDTTSSRQDDDNSPNWPDNYLIGAINAGKIKPGDEIEYTIYFLNAGGQNAENLRICDRITPNQDFKLNAYGNDGENKDLQLKLDTKSEINLTSASDTSDRAQLIPAGTGVDAKCNIKGTNDNGTLEIDITGTGNTTQSDLTTVPGSTGKGTPDNSYGFIRFTTTVKQ